MLCLRHFLGLGASRDYYLPTTMLVRPLAVSIERTKVVISALCGRKQAKQHFLLLKPDAQNCTQAFNAALDSITSFVHAERNMFVRFVQNRRRDCNVLIDVEQYNEESDDFSESGYSSSSTKNDMDRELLACQRAMRAAPHCYFFYTVEHGAVLWISALRSGEHGNRFPVDERTHAVIRFATLERYLRCSVTL